MSVPSTRYESQFSALYRRDLRHLHEAVAQMSPGERHHLFEATRRFLDMTRIIHKAWPVGAVYVAARHGDELFTKAFADLFSSSQEVESLEDAATMAVRACLRDQGDQLALDLLALEELLSSGEAQIVEGPPPADRPVRLHTRYDLIDFFFTLRYYSRANAPRFLYRTLMVAEKDWHIV